MSKKQAKQQDKQAEELFPLGKENYKLMLIGLGIIIIGFALMIGGGSDDPNVFSEEIFSFRRITLAPIIVLFGFIFQIYAIMKKPKTNE
jgi:membrane-bound ClpP family serine protease